MKHLFVPIELMKKLEEKGFAEDCICGYTRTSSAKLCSKVITTSEADCSCEWDQYDSEVRAATWGQAIDWFRDIKQIKIVENSHSVTSFDWSVGTIGQPVHTLSEAIEIALKLI